ncbi:outer membrane beta-barrel protein [Hyphococcus flavus]|uniref:Outer membrane beta-barrel protein n=1 Tax=Hyphococcus flavus TaxID=1866326 RepID=A0AAE9ZG04_9PROT|nr:outer membrane beta-barrel protein [Hyphococcus flavus]WDI32253.1 outer membrane beta-barrel protein [Hyphococcus flavus]
MRHIMLAAALCVTAATSAHADPYGKIFGGATFPSDQDITADFPSIGSGAGEIDTKAGYLVGGALGADLSKFFAIEGEVAYRSKGVNGIIVEDFGLPIDGNINALSFMGNAIVKSPFENGFTPYIGAGAGGARVGGPGDHDLVFAWQGIGGVSKNLSQRISAGVEYRYLDAATSTFSDGVDTLEMEYDSHSINLVLMRKF